MIEEYEKMYLGMTSDQKIAEKIEDTERKIEVARKKKSKLLELAALDSITAEDFKELSAQCNDGLAAFARELEDLREQQTSREDFRANMERIKKVLRQAEEDCKNGEITKEFIDAFVDKIFVTTDGNTARLDIKIFTGERCEKYLQKLKRGGGSEGRAGHTFKKMIDAYKSGNVR